MPHSNFKPVALMLLMTVAVMAAADADSAVAHVASLPKYEQECAACHIAYPPGLLPAASWRRLMGTLKTHYGVDASLDQISARAIAGWLEANAGSYKRVSEEPPQERITRSAWFQRKHRTAEVAPDVWKRASVGSASNCSACHTLAAQGSFREREIKIPK